MIFDVFSSSDDCIFAQVIFDVTESNKERWQG